MDDQDMVVFLLQFHSRWSAASVHGVTGWDVVVQLIEVLPDEWKLWVESIAPDFAVADLDWDTPDEADLQGLIDVIIAQYHAAGGPPNSPSPLVDLDDLDSPMIDVSDSVQDVVSSVDLSTPPVVSDADSVMDPKLADSENQYVYEHSPIDFDLYGQPFALDYPPLQDMSIPSTPASLPHPLPEELEAGPSRPPGMIENFKYEPEFLTLVGTTHLQPLPLSEMPFVTDPYILANVPEITFDGWLRAKSSPESEYVEDESEDDMVDEVVGDNRSTVLHFYQVGDGTSSDQWRVAQDDDDIQALLDDEEIWRNAYDWIYIYIALTVY